MTEQLPAKMVTGVFPPDQVGGLLGPNTRAQVIWQDDFVGGGMLTTGSATITAPCVFGTGWRCNTANSGTIQFVATGQSATVQGVLQLETVTNAASLAAFARFPSGVASRVMGSGQKWVHRWRVQVVTLSDGANRFVDRFGFINSIAAAPTDGLYFEYSDNLSSGNWRGVAMKASAPTVATGGSSVPVVAGAFVELEIIWNGTPNVFKGVPANTARFFVNGAAIGDVASTTLPANAVAEGASKIRSIGVAQRLTLIDYSDANLQWDPERAA